MNNSTLKLYENVLSYNIRGKLVVELTDELVDLIAKFKKMAENRMPLVIEKGDRSAIRSIIRELADYHFKLTSPKKWQNLESDKREQLILTTTDQLLKIITEKYMSLSEGQVCIIGPALIEWNFQATQWRNEE